MRIRFNIKKKFVTYISAIILVGMAVGIVVGYYGSYNLILNMIFSEHDQIAKRLSGTISDIINEEVANIITYSSSILWREEINRINSGYTTARLASLAEYFKRMDEEWIKSKDDSALLKEYIYNRLSARLKQFPGESRKIAEIFVTDKYGGLIGASGKTSDFYQADEDWWQKTYNLGNGKIYISDMELDESSRAFGIFIAVPIKADSGEIVGICKAVINPEVIFRPLSRVKIGDTGYATLVDEKGMCLFHGNGKELRGKKISDVFLRQIREQAKRKSLMESLIRPRQKSMLISEAKINNEFLAQNNIGWTIIIAQDAGEAFRPLYRLIAQLWTLLVVLLIVLIPIGYVISGVFTNPISKLHEATERIGAGDLDYKVDIKTGDEIEQLAESFNRMAASLKDKTTSIDNLNAEIEERVKAEAALTDSREWFSTTLKSIGDGVITTDPQGHIEFMNSVAVFLTGWNLRDAIGKPLEDIFVIVNEKTGGGAENPVRKVIHTGIIAMLGNHTLLVKKDGQRIPIDDSAAPIIDKDGRMIGVVLIFRDITDRKRTQESLVKANAEIRAVLNAVKHTAIVATDNKGIITVFNRGAENMLGYKAEEVVGKKTPLLFHLESEVSTLALKYTQKTGRLITGFDVFFEYAHGGAFDEAEWTYITKDGKHLTVELVITSLADSEGNVAGLLGVARDITDRKKNEARLRELSRAVEQSPAAVVITDTNANIKYVNPKFVQLTGYSSEEAMGKNPRILKSGEQPPDFYKELWQAISNGKGWHGEFHNKRKDGALYWESAQISPVFNEKGEITNYVAVKEDITARKAMETDLIKANAELKKLDQLKTDFVSTVSHELRTPLSITKEGISLVLDEIPGKINEKQSKILITAKSNIDRLTRIINDLLDISKIEAGRVVLKKKIVNIKDLMAKTMFSFAGKAKEKCLELKLKLPDGDIYANVDEDMLMQVMTNLVNNAIKFTEKGFVEISAEEKEGGIECTVTDTGPGIGKENIPKLFDKFRQFGRTAGAGEKGTGLGLSIAKGIIELHNGRIWASSELGKGTTFTFMLPGGSA